MAKFSDVHDAADHTGLTGIPTVVRKTSDETVDSGSTGTTLQNDGELLFAIGASETWVVEAHLFVRAVSATPDFKADWSVPAGATGRHGNRGPASGITTTEGDAHQQSAAIGSALQVGIPASSNSDAMVSLYASIVNSTNAGNVTLQWAQQNSSADDTTVMAGSFLIAYRVS